MNISLWVASIVVGGVAAVLAAFLVPPTIRLAHKLGALDHPDRRKLHNGPIPRIGGAAIVLGAGIPLSSAFLFVRTGWLETVPARELLAFIGASGMIFLLGLADDIHGVSVPKKIVTQTLAATVMVGVGWKFTTIALPLLGPIELGPIGSLLSVLWIVGIMNAINLMDGLDGLAAGLAAIVFASVMVLAIAQREIGTALACGAFAGACLGFLRHNWSPARIFMGDSGSLTLGFLLACLTLHASLKATTAVTVFVPVLALGLPAIDVVLVMLVRFVERPKATLSRRVARLFVADRQHLHHLMAATAKRRSTIVLSLYTLTVLFCLMAAAAVVSNDYRLALLLVILEFVVVVTIRAAGVRTRARSMVEQKRAEVRETTFSQIAFIPTFEAFLRNPDDPRHESGETVLPATQRSA